MEVYLREAALIEIMDGNAPLARLVGEVTGDIHGDVRRLADQYSTRRPTYAPSFTRHVYTDGVPEGYVVGSRHEMVNEFGWTDQAGRWHKGRFVMFRALRMNRIA